MGNLKHICLWSKYIVGKKKGLPSSMGVWCLECFFPTELRSSASGPVPVAGKLHSPISSTLVL